METIYPNGGINKMWEPLHIYLNLLNSSNLTIIGRTDGRDGCKLSILDSLGNILQTKFYTQDLGGPINRHKITQDFVELFNLVLEIEGINFQIKSEDLEPSIKILVDKCESRYGNPIPGVDYEAKIFFKVFNCIE